MNNHLYVRLAWSNLKKNRRFYFPYLISALFTVITFFTICTLYHSDSLKEIYGGGSLIEVLMFGSFIIGIFAVIFLLYTNGFLIKQRKKELGLYCILGLEKKHLRKVLLYETLFTVLFTVGGGLIAGTVLSKLLFLILLNLVRIDITIRLQFTVNAYIMTGVLFCAIFFVLYLKNCIQVHLTNPIDLLKGSNQGEKEPKASWFFALLGIALLGTGYYMAVSITNPLEAMLYFFIAVVLVILGTHLIFASSSVFLLKFLKKRKNFYYRPKNFISVGGMIYRMKQNAAGLANICILSTMVIVCMLSTFSLYIGQKDMMLSSYPREVEIREQVTDSTEMDQVIDQTLKDYSVETTFRGSLRIVSSYNLLKKDQVVPLPEHLNRATKDYTNSVGIYLIPLDDFNQFVGGAYQIDSEDQILMFDNAKEYSYDTIKIGSHTLTIQEKLPEFNQIKPNKDTIDRRLYCVVKDYDTALELCADCKSTGKNVMKDSSYRYYYLDLKGDTDTCVDFERALKTAVRETESYYMMSARELLSIDWYSTFGGMLFIGAYFGIIFLMATVLIIYYKQITEGYDDHDRFHIMQKVGMSKREIKSTIHKQILMVFILPLALAACHTCFALPMLKRIFLIFGLYNSTLVNLCTLATVVMYGIVYVIVYGITAKAYTRIVE